MKFDAPSSHRHSRDDASRVAVLERLELLDTPPEAEFDTIARLTATMLGCPVGIISLIAQDRQWTKAAYGAPRSQQPRQDVVCTHTIAGSGLMVIEDGVGDWRMGKNCMENGDPLAFYAGAPIHGVDDDGVSHAIGTLCVVDGVSRAFSDTDRQTLEGLASVVDTLIAARAATLQAVTTANENARQAFELRHKDRTFRQAERMAMIGSWRVTFADRRLEWSDGLYRIHDLSPSTVIDIEKAFTFYDDVGCAILKEKLSTSIATGESYDLESYITTATGQRKRIRSTGEIEYRDGVAVAIAGVSRDVTEEYAMQEALRRAADTDELTQIGNRAAFNRALDTAIATARTRSLPLALVLIDMDGFKAVNDTFGHLAGDDVLRTVGQRLRRPWLANSFAARIGGDEFAVLIDDPTLVADLPAMVATLQIELQVPMTVDGLTIATAGSVGASLLADHMQTPADFIQASDKALYAAKKLRVGDRRINGRKVAG